MTDTKSMVALGKGKKGGEQREMDYIGVEKHFWWFIIFNIEIISWAYVIANLITFWTLNMCAILDVN